MSQDAYLALCQQETGIPLFMQPYWLDVVAGKNQWTGIVANGEDGAADAAWAIYQTTQRGMKALVLPPLTPFTGIWIRPATELAYQKQIERRHLLLDQLESQLPSAPILELKLQFTLDDWLPFYWKGYRQETRYTFRIAKDAYDDTHAALSHSFKRNLRSADRKFEVSESKDVAGLYKLMREVFQLRGQSVPFDLPLLEDLYKAMSVRKQCAIYEAKDDSGVVGMIFVAWDQLTTYYLIGGRTGSNTRSVTNLLLWQAIEDAKARNHDFDFEGSMIKGVHTFFRSFGAKMYPYHFLYRYSGLARLKYLV